MYYDYYNGEVIRLSGENLAVGTTVENISELGSNIVFSALGAAHTLDVTSSSAADDGDPVGTGALSLCIAGLGASYEFQTETITLNGTTIVETTKSFLRVFCAEVVMAGTGNTNAGDIYAIKHGSSAAYTTPGVPDTLTSAWVKIPVGLGAGTSGIYTVPKDQRVQFDSLYATATSNASILYLMTHNPTSTTNGAFKKAASYTIGAGEFIAVHAERPAPIRAPEKTDIYLRGYALATGSTLNATLNLRSVPAQGPLT